MSTYLQLCQKMIRDLGLSNTISTVVGQTGMNQKIVDWVADADENIQTLYLDWNFLWSQHSETTSSGTREYNKPSNFAVWDLDSFYLDYTTAQWIELERMDYNVWRREYRQGTHTNDTPANFIITPKHNIYLEPIPQKAYALTADYWAAPTRMTLDASTSPIPTRFERIIIAQAKVYYAEHSEFAVVYESAFGEYSRLLKQLEFAEGPGGHRSRGRMSAHDLPMVENVI